MTENVTQYRFFTKLLSGVFLMLIASGSASEQVTSEIKHADTASQVFEYIKNLPQDTIIFLDIDDTIITPKSKAFRAGNQNTLIDEIKKDKKSYANYGEIISNWRLQRKPMLLDPGWPGILESMKTKFKVYGLTKMDTGRCGNIPSMEKWRYQELQRLGIEFSASNEISDQDSNFYRGIFFTGPASKADILNKYWVFVKTGTIVMVDDRNDYIQEIKDFCKAKSISCVGILFEGMKNLEDKPDSQVVQFQKDYLILHAKWLEDEEAEAQMLVITK